MKPIGLDTALARAVAANFDVEQFDDRAVRLTIRGRYSTMDMRTSSSERSASYRR